MSSDRSRRTDPPCFGYTGVVAQQGRVILDRDFNTGQGLTAARIAADALDFVGPCGTPDDGFLISLPVTSPPAPPFWTPPVSPPVESPPVTLGRLRDFLIAPGTMYLGGQRVQFAAEQNGHAITYSYFDQPDDPAPPPPKADATTELVYLDVTEQEVSAVEDPDLLEVALGGPDTTQRLKLLRRVRRMAVPAATCADAWATAITHFAAEGWVFDPATMGLAPAARLLVAFTQDASSNDPCDPVATGGFLGADNQLIRVRLAGTAAAPKLIWGYDNASFLYPITTVSQDGTTLTLAFDPPDAAHVPQAKQVVEILTTAAVLATEPNESGGPQPLLRVAAEPDGALRTLAQTYGPPASGGTGNVIVLASALPPDVADSKLPLFLRVWQGETTLTPGTAEDLKDPVTGTSTGVTVTVTAPGSPPGVLTDGAYWLIAVRPATPQGVYPETLLTAPQPPDGPRRWACPLAVIDWATGNVANCRSVFNNLVTLSARKPGCCTVTISLADVTTATPLQTLIDRAVGQAQVVKICLSAGTYALPAPLRLTSRHSFLTLEACGGPVILQADPKAKPARFTEGLIVLAGARSVTLRGLDVVVPYTPVVATSIVKKLPPGIYLGFGIRAIHAPTLTLDSCTAEFPAEAPTDLTYLIAAGIFLQGNCAGLAIRDCRFTSLLAPTYNVIEEDNTESTSRAATTGNRAIDRFAKTAATAAAPAPQPEAKPAATPLAQAAGRFLNTLRPANAAVSKATTLANRAQASQDVLLASQAVAAAEKKKPVIATVGILSDDVITEDGESVIGCDLGAATIRGAAFAGLTFATMLVAAAATLRLQDNTVAGGVAGLWYFVPDPAVPNAPAPNTATYYPEILAFEEFVLLVLLPVLTASPDTAAAGEMAAQSPALSLFMTGNQVDPAGATDKGAGASAALLLALNGAVPTAFATIGTQSTIIAGNQFRSAGGDAVPAALLTLPAAQPCAITGNVIVNIGAGRKLDSFNDGNVPIWGPSLWVTVADYAETSGTVLLSVTGNVLFDASDLSFLNRSVGSPPTTWLTYNANPA